ncbi:MAG: cytidine deaminase [Chloroflexota bacterium]
MRERLLTEVENFPSAGQAPLREALLNPAFDGIIQAELAIHLAELLKISIHELLLRLVPFAKLYASPPISQFYVGAVVQALSGKLYFGANFEFPGQALNATIHAEQSAILYAWIRGEEGIHAIGVNGAPCGHCRQFMMELNEPSLTVVTPQMSPQPLANLLPNAFTPTALGNPRGLMYPMRHELHFPSAAQDELANSALAMANRSYAPYSENHAGVAVRLRSGQIFAAPYAENVAFNPSVSPLQGVLIAMSMQSQPWDQVIDAVLVECIDPGCSQVPATRSLLATINQTTLRVATALSKH